MVSGKASYCPRRTVFFFTSYINAAWRFLARSSIIKVPWSHAHSILDLLPTEGRRSLAEALCFLACVRHSAQNILIRTDPPPWQCSWHYFICSDLAHYIPLICTCPLLPLYTNMLSLHVFFLCRFRDSAQSSTFSSYLCMSLYQIIHLQRSRKSCTCIIRTWPAEYAVTSIVAFLWVFTVSSLSPAQRRRYADPRCIMRSKCSDVSICSSIPLDQRA